MFKTFLKESNQLSKFQFACKYVYPAIAIFLTWGTLGNLYTLTLAKKDLVANKGQVISIGVRLETGMTHYQTLKYYPMIISLGNSTTELRVRDNFSVYFNGLNHSIQRGDTVTVYIRSAFDALISWGRKSDIYQIEKNGVVLFPLSVVKTYNRTQALISGLFALTLWLVYFVFRK